VILVRVEIGERGRGDLVELAGDARCPAREQGRVIAEVDQRELRRCPGSPQEPRPLQPEEGRLAAEERAVHKEDAAHSGAGNSAASSGEIPFVCAISPNTLANCLAERSFSGSSFSTA